MFRLLIKLILFFLVIYVGILFATPWVKYYIFKNAFENVVYNEKRFPDYSVKKNLLEEAKDLKIPIEMKDIKIIEENFKKIYSIEYQDVVKLPYVKRDFVFNFSLKAVKELEGESGQQY